MTELSTLMYGPLTYQEQMHYQKHQDTMSICLTVRNKTAGCQAWKILSLLGHVFMEQVCVCGVGGQKRNQQEESKDRLLVCVILRQ